MREAEKESRDPSALCHGGFEGSRSSDSGLAAEGGICVKATGIRSAFARTHE